MTPITAHTEHLRQHLHAVNAGGLSAFPAASYLSAAQELGVCFRDAQRILDQHGLSFRLDRLPRVGPDAFWSLKEHRTYRRGEQPIEIQAASLARTEALQSAPVEVARHILSRIWDSDGLKMVGQEYKVCPRFRFATKTNIEATAWVIAAGRGTQQSGREQVLDAAHVADGAALAAGSPDEDLFL